MKHRWTIAKILLGAALMAVLLLWGGIDVKALAAASSRWGYLIAGMLCLVPIIPLGALRWHALLGEQGIWPAFGEVLRLSYIGMFFNMCLPGIVSGDVVKGYYVARDHSRRKVAAATAAVFVDRAIGSLGLYCIAMAALVMNPKLFAGDGGMLALCVGIIAFFVLGWALVFAMLSRRLRVSRRRWLGRRGKLARFFMRLDDAVSVYRDRRVAAWFGLGVSFAGHFLSILACFLFGRAMGEELLGFREYMWIVPIGLVSNAIPISPMGLGVGETCFEGLFRLRGSAFGAEVQILWRTGMAVMGLVGFFFYVTRRRELAEALHAGRKA